MENKIRKGVSVKEVGKVERLTVWPKNRAWRGGGRGEKARRDILDTKDKGSLTLIHLCLKSSLVKGTGADGSGAGDGGHDLCTVQLPAADCQPCAVGCACDSDTDEKWS